MYSMSNSNVLRNFDNAIQSGNFNRAVRASNSLLTHYGLRKYVPTPTSNVKRVEYAIRARNYYKLNRSFHLPENIVWRFIKQ